MKPSFIIGIDEVGRGPVAGPVSVCALAFHRHGQKRLLKKFLRFDTKGRLKDSKRMTQNQREETFAQIKQQSEETPERIRFAISHVSSTVIDRIGIVRAVRRALSRSLRKLSIDPLRAEVWLDGSLTAPAKYRTQRTVIGGDATVPIIALASVMAKVERDRKMRRFSKRYPEYGFDGHVGYGTRNHLAIVRRFGPSDIHRRSFLSGYLQSIPFVKDCG